MLSVRYCRHSTQ